jgi:hypothetical protein
MFQIDATRERVVQAQDTAGLLAAAWDAFSILLAACRACQASPAGMFAAFSFAALSAAEGRLVLASAPSLPVGLGEVASPPLSVKDDLGITDRVLAGLAAVLRDRLQAASDQAGPWQDRQACAEAAPHAAQIVRLLAGDPA